MSGGGLPGGAGQQDHVRTILDESDGEALSGLDIDLPLGSEGA